MTSISQILQSPSSHSVLNDTVSKISQRILYLISLSQILQQADYFKTIGRTIPEMVAMIPNIIP